MFVVRLERWEWFRVHPLFGRVRRCRGSLEFNLALRWRSLGLTLLSLRAIDRESER